MASWRETDLRLRRCRERQRILTRSDGPRERLAWVDLFRGVAVLLMIETHVVNTFLFASAREAAWFGWLNYANGLVAPSFLFIAGFLQCRNLGSGRPVAFRRKGKRLLGIAVLGYVIQLPLHQLFAGDWPEALRVVSQVNILPCLAIALLMLLAGQRLTQRMPAAVWGWGIAALAVLVLALTPSAQTWLQGPVAFVALANRSTGSFFPLFPWLAFAFAGGLAGAFLKTRRQLLFAAAFCAALMGATYVEGYSGISLTFFFQRAAWVLALAFAASLIAPWFSPPAVLFAGRESLWIYAVHLGFIAALGVAGLPGAAFGVPATAILIAVVTSVTFLLVKARPVVQELAASARIERIPQGVAEEV